MSQHLKQLPILYFFFILKPKEQHEIQLLPSPVPSKTSVTLISKELPGYNCTWPCEISFQQLLPQKAE